VLWKKFVRIKPGYPGDMV